MSEHNTPKAGLDEASLDAILPSRVATTRYQDSAKQALIGTVKGGDDYQWDNWQATIEYGCRSQFDSILGTSSTCHRRFQTRQVSCPSVLDEIILLLFR